MKHLLARHLSDDERSRRLRELFGVQEKSQPSLSPETLTEIEGALKIL